MSHNPVRSNNCDQMGNKNFVVIARWPDARSKRIILQTFHDSNGKLFIPVFSDEETFLAQVRGTAFEAEGTLIDNELLCSVLRGDELLILNPGSPNPIRFQKADLMQQRLS